LVSVLNTIKATTSIVTDIRALGSMVAIELETAEQAKAIQTHAMENGLLILTCGRNGNVIRFLYPLTIPTAQFKDGLAILKQGFATLDCGHMDCHWVFLSDKNHPLLLVHGRL